ncbi:ABC transporter substrate-binding protein [Geomonas subterranea]|uniref:ABC transporter substrate-binding protein n=1 Tax=Geomonas subterranea TaxID=2847989 RepID=A0ABX8LN67_9BACT|nr:MULTISPECIES: ABC transporter substrate binding protein [Geomonas]QXE90960.1 ABC transporter substrate-binding protein [Geomonas subterranea]QXM10953.1 ABC transporter substrate-binding protein [Geomonas subterranea]
MRSLFLCILLLSLGLPVAARAAELLILQSSRSPVYSEALGGFRAAARTNEQPLVLSDYAEVDVQRLVREERPRLVVAVGDRALAACRKIREVPVVSLLSLSLSQKPQPDHIGGVTMVAPPGRYLELFAQLGARRVGVLYDPKLSGLYLKRAGAEAGNYGVTLAMEAVRNSRDLQAKLENLKGEVDLLWLLPDSTVVTTVNMEALLLFSMTRGIPAVTFTGQYLKNGAAAALDIDPYDMGVQAGELAQSLLRGASSHKVPVLEPRKVRLQVNDSVLRKLGLRIP